MLKPWNPEPHPFGNAHGLDRVSTDVYCQIAHRFGATVTAGKLPADLDAIQRPDQEQDPEPLAVLTVSWDGGVVSGDWPCGNHSVSGYWTSDWRGRINDATVVVDLRTVPGDRVVKFAVRGPMLDPSLPAGTVSSLAPATFDDPVLRGVAEDYLAPVGGLQATGTD